MPSSRLVSAPHFASQSSDDRWAAADGRDAAVGRRRIYRNSFKESATVSADTNTTLAATVDPCFES